METSGLARKHGITVQLQFSHNQAIVETNQALAWAAANPGLQFSHNQTIVETRYVIDSPLLLYPLQFCHSLSVMENTDTVGNVVPDLSGLQFCHNLLIAETAGSIVGIPIDDMLQFSHNQNIVEA